MASVPQMEQNRPALRHRRAAPGPLYDLPEGCRFAERCQHAQDMCRRDYPAVTNVKPGHTANCWMLDPSWSQPALAGQRE